MAETCTHTAFETQVVVVPYSAPNHVPEPGKSVQILSLRARCCDCQEPFLFELPPLMPGMYQAAGMTSDRQEAHLGGVVITPSEVVVQTSQLMQQTAWVQATTPAPPEASATASARGTSAP